MHRLALALGRTVGELEETMSAAEWDDWQEFQRDEPLPEARADFRAANIATILANTNRGRGTPAFGLSDFVFVPEMRKAAVEDEESIEDFARSMGAKIP